MAGLPRYQEKQLRLQAEAKAADVALYAEQLAGELEVARAALSRRDATIVHKDNTARQLAAKVEELGEVRTVCAFVRAWGEQVGERVVTDYERWRCFTSRRPAHASGLRPSRVRAAYARLPEPRGPEAHHQLCHGVAIH
jgi:hypothetical protein